MANALTEETSPYLLQHADNPVDWLPWSEEAFAKAEEEGKLVFLSVGYSTCHWCHVMAHESFEDAKIAEVLNHHFVCIKVDREERPDIDAAYMHFVQMTTGQGGWPMSVWLTPQAEPVFGGTYYPPEDRHGRPGITRVAHELGRLWRDDRNHMQERATSMMDQLQQSARPATTASDLPNTDALAPFIDRCQSLFDPQLGGFGGAPKFPRPVVLDALMQLADRLGTASDTGKQALEMVTATLHAMADGGMHDHLAGGFHRYSVDRYWHVPHYEKMLYDQAQLACSYLSGWQLTGDRKFRAVAEGIFHYLLTDMRDTGGAFHAAEDADSLPTANAVHTREGAYWTWEAPEISDLLAPRDAAIFCAAFGVEANGNARPESDPHHELTGQNTLFRAQGDDTLAEQFECSIDDITATIQRASDTLMQARRKRPMPHRDDKILTAWNGLTIAALARGGRLLERPDLTEAAAAAATFIEAHLWDGSTLYRSYRKHRGTAPGFPADYAFLIHGLIDLHAATLAPHWLDWARQLQDAMDTHCWSNDHSGYLMQPSLDGKLIMPVRDDHDGAEPSANHLAIDNLLRLATLLDHAPYHDRATTLIQAGAELITKHPFSAPLLLTGLDLLDRGVARIELPASLTAAEQIALQRYLPRAVITAGTGDRATICESQTCKTLA